MDFNQALNEASSIALGKLQALGEDIYLIRDLQGRIRVLLERYRGPGSTHHSIAEQIAQEFASQLGPYSYLEADVVIYRNKLNSFIPTLGTLKAKKVQSDGTYSVYLHDRLLIGGEWDAAYVQANTTSLRFTLFSMKGGVGRSTTAMVLAKHLADKGKRVLVFDLDLESPGVSATLLGNELPAYGIVDWFVEDAVGNASQIIGSMQAESPLQEGLSGFISVVPAFGTETKDYLSKLGRSYLERGPQGFKPWPERLKEMVAANERHYETANGFPPDIILFDSRTGLHDTSASLVLAMGANTLMFAVDTEQTWRAYRFLFEHWANHADIKDFYDKIWIIGSMVPETGRDGYLEGLRDQSYTLFNDTFYQSPAVTGHAGFTPTNRDSPSANHYPREIGWNQGLTAFKPLTNWPERAVPNAYERFLGWFDGAFLAEDDVEEDP
jgi:hypothetical protein